MIKQLSIEELLNEYTLLVPEIQREYVWGSKSNIEKVLKPFVESLDYNLGKKTVVNVGFLYSYTYNNGYCYVIDGQQRITTITLLLYVLACQCGKSEFNSIMKVSSPVMSFTYSVRSQTERFMKDLFNSNIYDKEEIFNQKWFISSYKDDTSIMSMVEAIDALNGMLRKLSNISFDTILKNVKFWYFNVEQTSQGEELYITMNSRGQKLSKSEHLKPYLLQKWQELHKDNTTDYGKKWDDWEEFFYGLRGNADIKAVDNAVDEYLKIILEIEGKKGLNELPKTTDLVDLQCIDRYMNAINSMDQINEIQKLFAENKKDKEYKILKAIVAESLKPFHFEGDSGRVKSVFENIVLRRGYIPQHDETLTFLNAFSNSELSFYDFVLENQSLCCNVIDTHEIEKIKIYKRYNDTAIELAFHDAEKMKVWNGNINPIIKWSCPDGTIESFDFELFKRYDEQLHALFDDKLLDNNECMDIVRRALLTQSLNRYPRCFRGNTNYSFASETNDWKVLIKDNIQQFKCFFDKLNEGVSLEQMIEQFAVDSDYSEFVHIPELMEYCREKNIQFWWGKTWYLIKSIKASGDHANIHAYKYFLENKNKDTGYWHIDFYPCGDTCVYYSYGDNSQNCITIDMLWNTGQSHDMMQIVFFLKKDYQTCTDCEPDFFTDIASKLGYDKKEDGRYHKVFEMIDDEREMFELMEREKKMLMTEIERKL